jgi:hypothetical protein
MRNKQHTIISLLLILLLVLSGCSSATVTSGSLPTSTQSQQVHSDSSEIAAAAPEDTEVYSAFFDATWLADWNTDISSSGKRSFKGLTLINGYEADSLYLSMAKSLEGFYAFEDFYANWGNDVVPLIWGFDKPENRDSLSPYVDEVSQYITTSDDALAKVMNKFSGLNSVSGTFDIAQESYHFQIEDVSACASELGITERALGYILAMIEVYAPDSYFTGNEEIFGTSYHCDLDVFHG